MKKIAASTFKIVYFQNSICCSLPTFLLDRYLLIDMTNITELFHTFFREEAIDYGNLDTSLRKSCQKSGLKDVDGM